MAKGVIQNIYGEANNDETGIAVSLSGDGNIVAIGAGNYHPYWYSDNGYAFVYGSGSDCAGCIDPLALNYDSTVSV